MKRWKSGAVLCALALCLCAAMTGCQSQGYTPADREQTVPSSALGKAGTLRVGVNASSAPLAGQTSSSSRIVGIDVDVAAYLADQMGVKVEIADVGNDPVSALSGGNVDIVLGVDASEADADYWRSEAYLQTGVALFASQNQNEAPAVDSHPKIAAQASSRSSWRVTNLFGDDSLVVQNDLKSAFEALASGSVGYVAADAVIGTYVSHSNGYTDKLVALLQDPSGYCVAVAKKNTELQSAVSAAVDKLIKGGMMDVIEQKWLGSAIDLSDVKVIKSAAADAKAKSGEAADPDAEDADGEGDGTADDGAAEGELQAEAAAGEGDAADAGGDPAVGAAA